MYIKNIVLKNYRNIKELNMELNPHVNIIYGENAQGKTNILESIYVCSTGKSQRSMVTDKEIVAFGEKETHIKVNVESTRSDKIDIHFDTASKSSSKKTIAVNGVQIQKLGDLFGILTTVFFGPGDLQLIKAGPAERRRFMDVELCQINGIYYYNLKRYFHILKERNLYLKMMRDAGSQPEILEIYDLQLIKSGKKLVEIRKNFIEKLNNFAKPIHNEISNGRESLEILYKPDLNEDEFEQKIAANREKDITYGITGRGVHKDDIDFFINGLNVKTFGSQGQQRSACLSTKLGEIELFKDEKGENPVLLLDDVFSELDKTRQQCLIKAIGDIQTVITCTGIEDSIKELAANAAIFNIKKGELV